MPSPFCSRNVQCLAMPDLQATGFGIWTGLPRSLGTRPLDITTISGLLANLPQKLRKCLLLWETILKNWRISLQSTKHIQNIPTIGLCIRGNLVSTIQLAPSQLWHRVSSIARLFQTTERFVSTSKSLPGSHKTSRPMSPCSSPVAKSPKTAAIQTLESYRHGENQHFRMLSVEDGCQDRVRRLSRMSEMILQTSKAQHKRRLRQALGHTWTSAIEWIRSGKRRCTAQTTRSTWQWRRSMILRVFSTVRLVLAVTNGPISRRRRLAGLPSRKIYGMLYGCWE